MISDESSHCVFGSDSGVVPEILTQGGVREDLTQGGVRESLDKVVATQISSYAIKFLES